MANIQMVAPSTQDEMRQVSFPDMMQTLYAYRKTIIVVVSICLAVGIFLSILPRKYKAEGGLWVEPGESSGMALSSLSSVLNGETNAIVTSEVDILEGRTVLLRVAKDLDLVNNKDFWGPFAFIEQPSPSDRTLDNAYTRDVVYKKLSHTIKIDNDPKDEIIKIDATTISPELSAKIVNALIKGYLAYLIEMRYGATQRATEWLQQQVTDMKNKVDGEETEITMLQQKLGVVGFNPQNATYLGGQSLTELTSAANEATLERLMAEAKLRSLKATNPNLVEDEITPLPKPGVQNQSAQSLISTLRASQAQASSNYMKLLSLYGPNYPEVKQVKAQLDDVTRQIVVEEQRVLNQAQLAFNSAADSEKMATAKLSSEKSKLFGDRNDMQRFTLLIADYSSDRALYEALVQHLQEASLTSALDAADVDVTDLATVPGKPTIFGPLLLIPGTLILGLILGCSLALWLRTLNRRIIAADEVSKATGLPLLAQVPHIRFDKTTEANQTPRLVVVSRKSHYAEAMQALRASLLLARPGSPPRVILFASAMPGEGKSTTAINLAATLALHGARVLVCDCDLRKGTLAKNLQLSTQRGISSVLTLQSPLEAAIQVFPSLPGLFVLADGPRPPDPAVLVGSDEMRAMVADCRERFDFVIIDSPPVLGIADGLHVGQLADAVIMVVRENVSNRKAVVESVSGMIAAHLPLAGFVFNDVDPRASGYSYGYSYRDYYSGYYTDKEEGEKALPEEVTR